MASRGRALGRLALATFLLLSGCGDGETEGTAAPATPDLVGIWHVDVETMPWSDVGPPPPPGYTRRMTIQADGSVQLEVVQQGEVQSRTSGRYERQGEDRVVFRFTHLGGQPRAEPYVQEARLVEGSLRFRRTDPGRNTDEIVFHRDR